MSDYRDDTQETAVASDSVWLGLTAVTEEVARASAAALFGLVVMHADAAAASDEVFDSWSHLVVEEAVASDELLDSRRSIQLVSDSARALDLVTGSIAVIHVETATATDEVIDSIGGMVTEVAVAAEEVIGQRYSTTLVEDKARASDKSIQATSVLVMEGATASDMVIQWAHMSSLVTDEAALSDEVIDAHEAAPELITATARASGEVVDHLHARDLVADGAVIEGLAIQFGLDAGQAWTASADSWAMSRYSQFTFESLAVINGSLYGVNNHGVFAIDGRDEEVTAIIKTGQLDIGGKVLVHPVSAYLEYELNGTAEMDVTTTQSGAAETYTYGLPDEIANELTNGRFVFGRGLRGRHFAFTLRMTGTHGHINDLTVMTAPTKRRV